jgi:hypothetical protein
VTPLSEVLSVRLPHPPCLARPATVAIASRSPVEQNPHRSRPAGQCTPMQSPATNGDEFDHSRLTTASVSSDSDSNIPATMR